MTFCIKGSFILWEYNVNSAQIVDAFWDIHLKLEKGENNLAKIITSQYK